MKEDKEYGEFFPLYISPFPYNDTVAHEYFPMIREEAMEKNLKWGDQAEKNYKPTIESKDLPEDINGVEDSILNDVIACEDAGACEHVCTLAYKIVPDELAFYRRKKIPLPRKCPNCRHYRRLAYRNLTKIWDRACQCAGGESENKEYRN